MAVHSPLRIFWLSGLLTVGVVAGFFFGLGPMSVLTLLFLSILELAFSFDNAIINARILKRLSKRWQTVFLTVGILIAVFGTRFIFPIIIVSVAAGLSWGDVIGLATQQPEAYAATLAHAHEPIVAFGGGFLLMLALYFLVDRNRQLRWWDWLERRMQALPQRIAPPIIAAVVIMILAVASQSAGVLIAGLLGIIVYVVLHSLVQLMERRYGSEHHDPKPLVGLAAFTTFVYLEVLDASFSFDGVIGAFAITTNVALIAAGLGIGAIWVRSLTVFMLRRGTLDSYRYLEHGAHYTVLVLAGLMLTSIFVHLPEWVAGSAGLVIIATSVLSSQAARKRGTMSKHEHD